MQTVGTHQRGVAAVAEADPDRIAVIDGDRRLTFGELDQRANGLSLRLADMGVEPGDAVGMCLRNRAEWFIVSHAIARLGAVFVPISPRLTRAESDYIAADSKMKACVAEDGQVVGGDGLPAIDVDDRSFAPTAPVGASQDFLCTSPVLMGYTSGTTGHPKAVERPAPRPVAEATTSAVAAFWGYGPDTVQLVCGPLYHAAPSAYAEYALWEGGTVVVHEGFVAERCLELIERHRVTRTQMVPAHFIRLLEADWKAYDRSSIRLVIHAAAACPVPVKWQILEVFPTGTVWELYGATEAMGTVISPGEWMFKPGSVGRPFPGLTVAVLRDDGTPADRGEVGTIYVSQFAGAAFAYRGDPDKTAEAYRDDMVTVGDLGHLDDHGYLFIADRRTDLIVSGGVNIYPAEVESALAADPDVVDSAVIGLPDPRMGQRVHAIIQLRPGVDPEPAVILGRLSSHLAGFKCPTSMEFVDTLSREPNGKVLKRLLQQDRAGGAGSVGRS